MYRSLGFYNVGDRQWGAGFPAKIEKILTQAAGRNYADFDYDPHTSFEDVRRVLDVAITIAATAPN